MQIEGLHKCTELPVEGPVLGKDKVSWYLHRDADAVEFIKQRFTASTAFAGKGAFGAVVALNDVHIKGKASLAVKVLPFRIQDTEWYDPYTVIRDVEQELFIACQVNQLHEYTPVFIQTYGWLVSSRVPKNWQMYIDIQNLEYEKAKKLSYMFMFMEQSTFKFDSDSVVFTEDAYLRLLFVLLHALYVAGKHLKFTHNDLHKGNIMMDVVHTKFVDLDIEGKIVRVDLYNQFMPKIIDFGRAKTEKAHDGGRNENDVVTLFRAVLIRNSIHQPTLNLPTIEAFSDFEMPIAELLLKHSIFENVRKTIAKTNKKQKLVERCSMCGAEATVKFKHCDNYKFCHEYCANKMKGLAFLI